METPKNNNALKAIIFILSLLLLGSIFYIYQLSTQTKVLQTEIKTEKTEKENVLKDLEELKSTYDAAIAENSTLSDELIEERDKVTKLIEDLKKSDGNLVAMSKYKSQYNALQTKMKSLMQEIEVLKVKNTELTTNLDSTKVVLEESKNYTKTLVGQNEELSKTIDKGSKLSVLNLKTSAFKLKSSGKVIETDKARRVDFLKISFTIAENSIAKTGDKKYYVQVIDSKSNVLGNKATENFGDKNLTYSFTTTVKYENKTIEVSENLPGKSFEKGTYFINVFDKNELVSKSSFTLN